MKKIIVSIFVILIVFDLYSQKKSVHKPIPPVTVPKSQPPQAWIGIFAGPNLNYLDYYDKTTTLEGKSTVFHAGMFYQKKVNRYFALQPALMFVIRGGRIKDVDSTVTASLMNIELPINFLYLYQHIIIGAGPNFTYGIHGTLKSNGTETNAYDVNASFERTLKRFQFGGNFLIGYTLKKGIFVTANFSPGFTNIYKGDGTAPDNVRAKTRMFGISIGYLFGLSNDPH